jgi:RNA polymerase-interacting CarD/CdnL/TRCF family regulator
MAKVAQFEKGKTVVFGPEGFARVEGISERVMLGEKMTVVNLFVLDSKMNVTVPLDRAVERGLRLVTTKAAAERSLEAAGGDLTDAVDRAYERALGRRATDAERHQAVTAAQARGLGSVCWALLNSSEFLYVQ